MGNREWIRQIWGFILGGFGYNFFHPGESPGCYFGSLGVHWGTLEGLWVSPVRPGIDSRRTAGLEDFWTWESILRLAAWWPQRGRRMFDHLNAHQRIYIYCKYIVHQYKQNIYIHLYLYIMQVGDGPSVTHVTAVTDEYFHAGPFLDSVGFEVDSMLQC